MKKLILSSIALFVTQSLLSVYTINGQEGGGGGTDYNALTSLSNNNNAMGSARSVLSNPPKVLGSNYVFENWNNDAVVTLDTGRNFSLKQNFNINAAQGTFESKSSETTVFSFDLNNIKSVTINNDRYTVARSPEENKLTVFQELGSYGNKSLLKGFRTELILGHPDPLRGQVNDKIVIRDRYYFNNEGTIKKIKLKKSTILDLFGDDSKSLKKFIKTAKLNFKEDGDFKRLFAYLNSGQTSSK